MRLKVGISHNYLYTNPVKTIQTWSILDEHVMMFAT